MQILGLFVCWCVETYSKLRCQIFRFVRRGRDATRGTRHRELRSLGHHHGGGVPQVSLLVRDFHWNYSRVRYSSEQTRPRSLQPLSSLVFGGVLLPVLLLGIIFAGLCLLAVRGD